MNLEKILFVDPGTRRLGWAIFRGRDLDCSGVFVERPSDGDWLVRSDLMADSILATASKASVGCVVIEQPQMFLSSTRGMQAMDTGSVLKLMSLVMILRTSVIRQLSIPVELIPVSVWKGQVPKHITQSRVERRYSLSIADDNEADAIALGDWYIRLRPKKTG